MKRYLDDLAVKKDWNSMNIQLIQSFFNKDPKEIIFKHASVRYFMHMKFEENNTVVNPVSIEAIIKGLD